MKKVSLKREEIRLSQVSSLLVPLLLLQVGLMKPNHSTTVRTCTPWVIFTECKRPSVRGTLLLRKQQSSARLLNLLGQVEMALMEMPKWAVFRFQVAWEFQPLWGYLLPESEDTQLNILILLVIGQMGLPLVEMPNGPMGPTFRLQGTRPFQPLWRHPLTECEDTKQDPGPVHLGQQFRIRT
jgi:hypothetical protein